MCRSCVQGGRRCPGETPAKRRARQKAGYHAKKAQQAPVTVPDGTPAEPPHTPSASAPRGSREAVAEAVTAARAALDSAGPLIRAGKNGWDEVTADGLAVEASVRAVGEAMNVRAEALAQEAIDKLPEPQRPPLAFDRPEGFADRRQYMEHVQDIRQNDPDTDRAWAAAKELMKLRGGTDSSWDKAHGPAALDNTEAQLEAYSNAYRQVLSEQRQMGVRPGTDLELDPLSQKTATGRLREALEVYPRDWIDREGPQRRTETFRLRGGGETEIAGTYTLRVRTTRGRAHYAHGRAQRDRGSSTWETYDELTIDTSPGGHLGPGISTAIHEYGHRQERLSPQVNEICQTFLARRTTDADGERHALHRYHASGKPGPATMEKLRSSRQEWVRPNGFVDQYIGKEYGRSTQNSEVFTVGMEGVFAGRYGGLRGAGNHRADPEHRDLILGVLATVK